MTEEEAEDAFRKVWWADGKVIRYCVATATTEERPMSALAKSVILSPYARLTVSFNPKARTTFNTVANSGCPSRDSAL